MTELETIEIGGNFKNKNASVITLNGLDDLPNFNDDKSSKYVKKPSVNFGSGIELLMNEKRKNEGNKSNQSSDIDLGDINELENELNDLNELREKPKGKTRSSLFNSVLSGEPDIKLNDNDISLNNQINLSDNGSVDENMPSIKIGKETVKEPTDNKTWDGFQKFNDVTFQNNMEHFKNKLDNEEFNEGGWQLRRRRRNSWD